MKPFLHRSTAVILLALSSAEAAPPPEDDRVIWNREWSRNNAVLSHAIENYIFNQIVGREDFGEEAQARHYAQCDLDGDGQQDLVVTVLLNPNKGADKELYCELLCVLSSAPERIVRMRIGRYGERVASKLIARYREVFVEYDIWGKSDASCCPSLKATERLTYRDKKLVLSSSTGPNDDRVESK